MIPHCGAVWHRGCSRSNEVYLRRALFVSQAMGKEVSALLPLEAVDVVNMTNRILASGFDLKQVTKGIAAELKRHLRVDWMTLILLDADGSTISIHPFRKPCGRAGTHCR